MRSFLAATLVATSLAASPALAGNIVLTGHDNDYHQSSDALAQAGASLAFVRNGSTLPVLSFDSGSELTSMLTTLGISFTNVNPNNAALVTDALFDHSLYSAFVVASLSSCGGCDNSPAGIMNIAAHTAAITQFFDNGGGIYGLAGASDSAAYAYVPETATNPGGTPSAYDHVQTAAGATLGIPAVNGDATHNFFSAPGTAGLSSLYQVVETQGSGGTPLTVALSNGAITCTGDACVITGGGDGGGGGGTTTTVPEPASFGLLGLAWAGIAAFRRGRKAAA